MEIETLYAREELEKSLLSPALERLYDGGLSFPQNNVRPYVIGNFVETLDGVISYGVPGKAGGGPISGNSAEDRFTMGLLRAMSDAVLIGSGTLHGDSGHVRTPEFAYPEANGLFLDLRKTLEKPALPINVVLTASGKVDLGEPTFHTDGLTVVIVTTEEGAARLARDGGRDVPAIVRSTGEENATTPEAALGILSEEFGVKVLLHEGGPTSFGQFLAARLIDELFLTLSPQIAGRQRMVGRPSLAGEAVFFPESAPWLKLKTTKRGGDHLLLRYAT